jgi:hypothetical protein
MSFQQDAYAMPRKGTTNLTATEAAGVNNCLIPPGEYKWSVLVPIVPTGTSPTLTVTLQEAADGAAWAALTQPASLVVDPTKSGIVTGWAKISKNPNSNAVAANVTAVCTVGGTPSGAGFGKVQVAFDRKATSGWNGQP